MMTKEEILKLDLRFLAYEEDIQEYFDVEIPQEIKNEAERVDKERQKFYEDNIKFLDQSPEKDALYEIYLEMDSEYDYIDKYIKKQVGFPESELVDQEGGGEGEGEYCHWVRYYPELNFYLKVTANYYSYDGVDFDYGEVYEVEPKEVLVTQYHKK